MKEIWKDINVEEGRYNCLYQVSNLGRIRYIKNLEIKNLYTVNSGYTMVRLSNNGQKRFGISRLVALTFLDAPTNGRDQINHINGIKTDNCVENLEWCTRSENIHHAYVKGLMTPYIRTDENKKKISDANLGHIVSKETRRKLSKSCTGNKHSEVTKRKISLSMKKYRAKVV